MNLADRVSHNEHRRWQYLAVRIETNKGRLAAYEAEHARLMLEKPRNWKRIMRVRDMIEASKARIRKLRTAKAAT